MQNSVYMRSNDAAYDSWLLDAVNSQGDPRLLMRLRIDAYTYMVKKARRDIFRMVMRTKRFDVVCDILSHANSIETNPNAVTCEGRLGRTPLHYAVEHGCTELMGNLLKYPRIDPNVQDTYDRTPLHYATDNESTEQVSMLVNCPFIDPNVRDKYGRTPLHYASKRGHVEIVSILLKCPQMEPNSQDEYGRTPLAFAIDGRRVQTARQLMSCSQLMTHERTHMDVPDNRGRTLLHLAALMRNSEIMKILLEKGMGRGIRVDAVDTSWNTALYYASRLFSEECVALLLSAYAFGDINVHIYFLRGKVRILLSTKYGNIAAYSCLSCSKSLRRAGQ